LGLFCNSTRREFLDQSLRVGSLALGAGLLDIKQISGVPKQKDLGPWQIGCYTRPWDQYDYREALDAIAEAGYPYVGLMTTKSKSRLVISVETTPEEAAQVGQEVAKRKLEVLSVYGGGIPVSKSLEAGIEGLKRLIDNCAACGAKNLLMGGVGNKDLHGPYYKAIAECCDYAAAQGIGISVKPHGGLNATGPQCRKTIESVGHTNFRIWYDPGNIFYYSDAKLNPIQDAATVDGLVIGMCIKDYQHPKKVMITPGTGQVDFSKVMARLIQGGFTKGPLIVECLERGEKGGKSEKGVKEKLLVEAKKAREFIEELVSQKAIRIEDKGRLHKRITILRGGVATVDITPPIGYRMSGYFHERLSTGILNPLHAKALVLEQGGERLALVACDIIGIPREVSDRVRKQAAQQTGIPIGNILIHATHSHTGPLYWGALRNYLHEKAMAEHGSDPCEKEDYPGELVAKLVQVIRQAKDSLIPMRIETGVTEQQGLSFNRRFHMKDGTVRFNPGVKNPNIVKVAGPIDPEVGMVFFRDIKTSKALAGMVNFALHLDTVGGTKYAADYPYYLEQTLREKQGQDFVLLYGTGTCGDINHIDVTRKERLKTDFIGNTLGKTVNENSDELKQQLRPMPAARSKVLQVPMQQFDTAKIEWAKKSIEKVGTRELSFLEQVEAYKILACQMRGGATMPLEVQVFRLSNEVAVVGLPGEVFVDLGLAIKKASPFPVTLVIELCQDCPGYIPTTKAFTEGSYETVNSRIAPGGGEQMAETAIRLLRELKPPMNTEGRKKI
jgi:sugar phosphate isomerase/epimerase